MVGIGTLWISIHTQGSASLMSINIETRFLDGLRKLDPQSVGAIYDQYFPEVYRYARYRVNDEALAEDIASDEIGRAHV